MNGDDIFKWALEQSNFKLICENIDRKHLKECPECRLIIGLKYEANKLLLTYTEKLVKKG